MIRKYLRAGTVEPRFKVPDRPSKLDPFAERLSAWLKREMSGRGTFVPLSFAPGEAFQFDWSDDWAIIAGVRTKLQVAHFKLSYSRAFLVRA